MKMSRVGLPYKTVALLLLFCCPAVAADSFRFVILGDRTGEAQPGVWQQVWREAAADHPAFVVTVGDTIQGANDATAEAQWRAAEKTLKPYARIPLYLTPGNHDIWSARSEDLFRKYAHHPPHYGFDYGKAHFTILDNSRSDDLGPEELAFLEEDLKAHAAQPLKFIISHRPSWIVRAALQSTDFPLHQLARKYGVRYVIAGHIHQMLRINLEGVTYLSLPSAGGHLRATGRYQDGWFFAHLLVEVEGADARFQVKELKPPHGEGRVTALSDWGMLGLSGRWGFLVRGDSGQESVGSYGAVHQRSFVP
jgi:Calcineurin-like phosphoesterase